MKRFPKLGRLFGFTILGAMLGAVLFGLYLGWQVTREFAERGWDTPARVYAAPLELYPGRQLQPANVAAALEHLGYTRIANADSPGSYSVTRQMLDLTSRAFMGPNGLRPASFFRIEFDASGIRTISDESNTPLAIAVLDPMLIGSIFPDHGEDRIVLSPDEVPTLLIEGLKAVEDRRFDNHFGVDIRGIARAAWVNIRSGSLEQGASTLTQQLIRSYYLDTERTWSRKIREAFMSVALELQKDKDEIAHAYVNEVYLGQDGARAIHGFGLAARYYFGRPLGELQVHQLAMLIGQVRGPSFYDPRRNPQRAKNRRDLILSQMAAFGLIDSQTHDAAVQMALDLAPTNTNGGYYAGFLDLVRRQLREDYEADSLESKGLRVFTTIDPQIQAVAEAAVHDQLEALQAARPRLDAAVIVTTPQNAEVKALVGGRQPGFNRALDAHRQVGSLIKPAVYLAALESLDISLASLIEDGPIDVKLEDGSVWSPSNFEGVGNGEVTIARALAESLNMATVRLGMLAGVGHVAELIARLGLDATPSAFPSLLLGAIDLTPFEVAGIYNTLASGGFREPLRAVRAVVDADGQILQHYRIEIEQAAQPDAVYALNRALVQVMQRGTGRTAQRRLPAGLTTAGKTGTSDDLRDSWFAGFSNDHLVVAWVGNDANESIGLTGSAGAARIWSDILADLETRAFAPPTPSGVADIWIDYNTGLATDSDCANAALLGISTRDIPPPARRCGSERVRFGSRIRRLFDGSSK